MASAKTTTFALPRLRDLIEHDDEEDDDLVEEEDEDEDDDEEEDWDIGKRMSRLSVAGSDGGDADDEDDGGGDDEEDEEEVRSDGVQGDQYGSQPWHPYGSPGNLNPPSSASLPGTPERGAPSQSPWGRGYSKDYASETEAAWWPGGSQDMRRQQHRRQRMMREVWLDRAWQMRKQRQQRLGERGVNEVTVLVGKGGGESPVVAMGHGGDARVQGPGLRPAARLDGGDPQLRRPQRRHRQQRRQLAGRLRQLAHLQPRRRSQGSEGEAQGMGASCGTHLCLPARFLIRRVCHRFQTATKVTTTLCRSPQFSFLSSK